VGVGEPGVYSTFYLGERFDICPFLNLPTILSV
jgi:hypothetical protein